MSEQLRFGDLVVQVGASPPVYDPGGATWIATSPGATEEFEAALAAGRDADAAQLVVPFGDGDILRPLGFQAISDFWQGDVDGGGGARAATSADMAFMLDLAAARRAAYADVQPVFWREAADARVRQAAWFEHLLTLEDHRAFVDPAGFLLAAPKGGAWLVDDFAVREPADWTTAGRTLLMSLEGSATVICACHDTPKQDLLRSLDFQPRGTWYQIAL